jgi:site-specific DNA-methyltransferase (adenine-specific)
MNIDGCRVGVGDEVVTAGLSDPSKRVGVVGSDLGISNSSKEVFQAAQIASLNRTNTLGRWPANVIHDGSEEVVRLFPQTNPSRQGSPRGSAVPGDGWGMTKTGAEYTDSGSAARFFYCAKASKADRGENNHPTVKPTDLMRYLCRLVTPPGGTVLDPFMGSGSTGKAAITEGFQFIGIELNPEYVAIAEARIGTMQPLFAAV